MIKKNRKEIRNFFLTNKFSRRVKNFLHQIFIPIFLKIFLGSLTLLLLILLMFKIFKPVYLQKISQKSSFYFFHYLNLDNHEFSKTNISGNKRVAREEIEKIVVEAQPHLVENVGDD